MGFFDSIGNAATKAKLSAEIALIDRELNTRKKAFGVELYDVIDKQQKRNEGAILETPGLFKTIENEIKGPLEKCSKEMHILELEKRNMANELELMEAKRMNAAEAGGLGKTMADTAKGAELNVKMAYLDREMLIKKEQFGLEVWDNVSGVQWLHEAVVNETKNKSGLGIVTGAVGGLAKGVKGTVTKTLGKVSGDERAIEGCVNKAKQEVKVLEDKKKSKQTEINVIDGKK
mmetsp:Transcript_100906/g.151206  ORF Transcript_100906/g.151206 Transcript_100906/m.151206 type:complete len:232 (-) Transcript_100906:288-983(-)